VRLKIGAVDSTHMRNDPTLKLTNRKEIKEEAEKINLLVFVGGCKEGNLQGR
jgi:hypothetical protein